MFLMGWIQKYCCNLAMQNGMTEGQTSMRPWKCMMLQMSRTQHSWTAVQGGGEAAVGTENDVTIEHAAEVIDFSAKELQNSRCHLQREMERVRATNLRR